MKVKGCVEKICALVGDILYVVDGSGSIDSDEWVKLKEYISNSLDSFDFTKGHLQVAFISYGGGPTIKTTQMYSNRTEIDTAVKNLNKPGSSTPTGDALVVGITLLSTLNQTTLKVVILLTDGESNMCTVAGCKGYSNATKKQLESSCVTCIEGVGKYLDKTYGNKFIPIAIGVDGADRSELDKFVGTTRKTTNVAIGEWGTMGALLNGVISYVCSEYSTPTTCKSCKGFCGTNSVCYCPTGCTHNDKFSEGKCGRTTCNNVANVMECTASYDQCYGSECWSYTCAANGTCLYTDQCAKYSTGYPCISSAACSTTNKQENGVCIFSSKCDKGDQCTWENCSGSPTLKTSTCVRTDRNCLDNDPTTKDTCDGEVLGGCIHEYCPAPEEGFRLVVLTKFQPEPPSIEDQDRNRMGCKYEKINCVSTPCLKSVVNDAIKACVKSWVKCPPPVTGSQNCGYYICNDASTEENPCELVSMDCGTYDPCIDTCKLDQNDACMIRAECIDKGEAQLTCVREYKNVPSSKCYNYICDPATGSIKMTPLFDASNCEICDENTGETIQTCISRNCNVRHCDAGRCISDGNPCSSKVPETPCQPIYCNESAATEDKRCFAVETCVGVSLAENTDTKCYTVKCNPFDLTCYKEVKPEACVPVGCEAASVCDLHSGDCKTTPIVCETEDLCTTVQCNEETRLCEVVTNKHWDGTGDITKNLCFQELTTKNITKDPYCFTPICNPVDGKCMYEERNCLPANASECFDYYCKGDTNVTSCELVRRTGELYVDDGCGGCLAEPGDACPVVVINPKEGIGITVGVAIGFAAVVVVIVLVVLLSIGSKKTYDLVMKSRESGLTGAKESPIFEANKDNFDSPAFAEAK